VKIGNQVWMAENLNYDAGSGSWCYDNSSSNCSQYGRMYDWATAKTVAPAGWHLPSKEEFEILLKNLGGSGTSEYTNIIPSGTSGFSALFGGWRSGNGDCTGIGKSAGFWSATGIVFWNAWCLWVTSDNQKAVMGGNLRKDPLSVRLLKD
jgi:uncharacterized protein (TIGR02145 family)